MRWTRGTLEFGTKRSRLDGGALPMGIHRLRIRREHQLDTLATELFDVRFQGARVRVEILADAEL
ncbi:Uncharacterised protein [Mycobacteroides abscessus subsp. massiliense]|nr:Uncharacterised protein [Mycobacteroides abscessus subsp. massiliense]